MGSDHLCGSQYQDPKGAQPSGLRAEVRKASAVGPETEVPLGQYLGNNV